MAFEEHEVEVEDGRVIPVFTAEPSSAPRGTVQILHGLAEHAARYARVADALTGAGWAVLAHDHRGHGPRASGADLGFFAETDGMRRVVEDVRRVRKFGRARWPEGDAVLFGHSMGSYIAVLDQTDAPGSADRMVLSGGTIGGGLLPRVGLQAAKVERWRQGPRGRSALLEKMSFGSFNDAFQPARTEFDWLSRDPEEVDAYIEDPRCGFRATNQLWIDLIGGILEIGDEARLARLPKDMPIYMFCGGADPVSKGGEGVQAFGRQLRRVGCRDVSVRVYPNARHETLNETNRDEVTADLLQWLERG